MKLRIYRNIFFSFAILGAFLWLLGIISGNVINLGRLCVLLEGCGAFFTFVGSFGSWHYNNRLEKVFPYIQPLRFAQAFAEIHIRHGKGIVDDHILIANWKNRSYIILKKVEEEIIKMSSNFSSSTTLQGEDIWSFRTTMNLEKYGPPNKQIKVYDLKETDYIELCLLYVLTKKGGEVEVISGDITFIFNNSVQVILGIPAQKTKNGIVYIKDTKKAFAHFQK